MEVIMSVFNKKYFSMIVTMFLCILCMVSYSYGKESLLIIRPEGDAFEDCMKGLSGEISDFDIHQIISDDNTTNRIIAKTITELSVKAVVLMDNRAINLYRCYQNFCSDSIEYPPAIACMGVDIGQAVKGMKNIRGVSYEIPIVTSMVNLRSILGIPIKRVGVVHREFMNEFVRINKEYCNKENLSIISCPLPDSIVRYYKNNDCYDKIRSELKRLIVFGHIDAFWIPNDNSILKPEMLKNVWIPLLQKYRKPIVVCVQVLVNPALDFGTFAVLPDHVSLGSQIADVIFEIMDNDWEIDKKIIEPPLSIKKTLNLSQAKKHFNFNEKNLGKLDTFFIADESEFDRIEIKGGMEKGDLSLGNLLNMEITSVSKKVERLQDVAASVYVITKEDIRRSGATRLSEILRLVPGVWIAEHTFDNIILGIHEIPGFFTQSVNVLMDGVPLSNPVVGGFSFFGAQLPISRVKRIEVIKGPGGTIYGANSTTGIINIITEDSKESEGSYFHINAGTGANISPLYSYGRSIGEQFSFSAYASFKHYNGYDKNPDFVGDELTVINPISKTDTTIKNVFTIDDVGRNNSVIAGLNLDAILTGKLNFQAKFFYRYSRNNGYLRKMNPWPDIMFPSEDSLMVKKTKNDRFLAKLRFDYTANNNHNAFLNLFYTVNNFYTTGTPYNYGGLKAKYHLTDLEFQDNLKLFSDKSIQQSLTYGLNCRIVNYDIGDYSSGCLTKLVDPKNTEYIVAGFLQNQMSFGHYVDFISGIKAETWTLIDNKPEFSPSFKLSIKPNKKITTWGAWSRSITTPSYSITNVETRFRQLPSLWFYKTFPDMWKFYGLPEDSAYAGKWCAVINAKNTKPPEFFTTEGGLKTSLIPHLVVDISAFYTVFKDKIGYSFVRGQYEPLTPSKITGELIVPFYYSNLFKGVVYGMETVIRAQISNFLRQEISYSFQYSREEGQKMPGSDNKAVVPEENINVSPTHIIRWRSYLDLPHNFHLTINGLWNSIYDDKTSFDYVAQNPNSTISDFSTEVTRTEACQVKLDIILEKMFWDDRVCLNIWGKNILNDHYVEGYNELQIPYPQTVHRTFGGGVSVGF